MPTPIQLIKFRHLQCFIEVAQLGSVGQAADSLGVSQPAISKTLRELEEALEVKLFDRAHRRLQLTSFGKVFLRHAGSSVSSLRQGVDAVAQARGGAGFAITIGALPTVSTRVLPDAVKRFKADSPQTRVQIITGENTVLMSQLKLGALELVVGRLGDAERMTGLTFEHLYSEQVGLFVRKGHPLTHLKPFSVDQITQYTLMTPGRDAVIRPTVDRFLIANGIGQIPDRIETVSTPFGRAYLANSYAIWIISRGVLNDDLESGAIVELPLDMSETAGPVGLTLRADEQPALAVQLFIQCLRDAVKRIK